MNILSIFVRNLTQENMRILITNDDGYQAKGINVLVEIMKQFGDVTVIAPKTHQSGMAMALSLGFKQIAHKDLGDGWHYLDATPASCVKFGLNTVFADNYPDVVVSGINHGSNASVASCYSGTLGAAAEAALNGVPAIGVSLDSLDLNADFSGVARYFGEIFSNIMKDYPKKHGVYYNVNFPDIPADQIKGVRAGYQGVARWVREFREWDINFYKDINLTPEMLGQSSNPTVEEGEELYMMVGELADDPRNTAEADHLLIANGYVSVVAHNIDCTDYEVLDTMRSSDINKDF
jgi:5'-nucleotidase